MKLKLTERAIKEIMEQPKKNIQAADNWLTCDASGNCMLKDELAAKDNFGMNVGVGGMNFGFKTDDNSLTCDSVGNCMLKDELLYGATSSTWTPKMADNSLTCDA